MNYPAELYVPCTRLYQGLTERQAHWVWRRPDTNKYE